MYHKNKLIIAGLIVAINSIAQGYEPVNVQLSKMNKETVQQIKKLNPFSSPKIDTIVDNAFKKAIKAAYPYASIDKIESLVRNKDKIFNFSDSQSSELETRLKSKVHPSFVEALDQADEERKKELDFHKSEESKKQWLITRWLYAIPLPPYDPEYWLDSKHIKKAWALTKYKQLTLYEKHAPEIVSKALEIDKIRQKVEAHLKVTK